MPKEHEAPQSPIAREAGEDASATGLGVADVTTTSAGHVDAGHGRDADKPSEIPARGWKDVAMRIKDGIKDDHSSLSAAGVAFFGFLAFIPGLAALVSVYGLFASPGQVESRVQGMFSTLPAEAKDLLTDQLSRLTESSGASLGLGLIISLALALWSASSGMSHLLEAINLTYNEKETRGFIKLRGMALGLTMAILVVAAVTIAGMSAASALGDSNAALRWILNIATWAVVGVLFVSVLSVLYRFGNDRDDPKWRWVTPGSVVATVLWAVISIAFQIYVSNFGSYNKTYGSLAAVVIMLFWLFLSAFVVLVGAQVNSELEHQTMRDSTVGPAMPMGSRDAQMADTVGRSS